MSVANQTHLQVTGPRQAVVHFFHVLKTGGTSLTHVLEARFPQSEVCPARLLSQLVQLSPDILGHYKLFTGHFGHNLKRFVRRPIKHITLVRDPVAHVISIYHHFRRDPSHPLYEKIHRQEMSLADFVRDDDAIPFVHNPQSFHFGFWHQVWNPETMLRAMQAGPAAALEVRKTQHAQFRTALSWRLLEEVFADLNSFAFVGITEQMEASGQLLAYTFGWRDFGPIPFLNASKDATGRHGISPPTLSVIRDLTRWDAELYNYARDLFARRTRQMLQDLDEQHVYRIDSAHHQPRALAWPANFGTAQTAMGEPNR
jgi:hypothetical protein